MTKLNWQVVHECDDEIGNPTAWAAEINHYLYGKYCWIIDNGDYFSVEIDCATFDELVKCKTLSSAKRWASTHLMK